MVHTKQSNMEHETKRPIGMKLRPSFWKIVKDAAWKERVSMNQYFEIAAEKLMKEQGHWPGDAGMQPDPDADR